MEYMFGEGNHKFRKAVSIINLYAILISFNLFHILNIDVNHIKMLINNNDANGLVRYRGIRYSLMLSIIWQKEGWRQLKKYTIKVIINND